MFKKLCVVIDATESVSADYIGNTAVLKQFFLSRPRKAFEVITEYYQIIKKYQTQEGTLQY